MVATFMVQSCTASYHPSTDALTGFRYRTEGYFGTYDKAINYIERQGIEEDFDFSFAVFLKVIRWNTVKEYGMHDLHANSYYHGPAGTVPF